jgi:23S rRNA (uridine2552-2'-O)-methyltransferase
MYERKDSFYRRAKREGLRSRAAYKLEELQRGHRVLRAGQRVVELGAWPGGWLQVAAAAVGPGGRVVGVDVAGIEPFPELANVIAIQANLEEPGVSARILEALGGPADVVLSDAAPKLTGIRATDRAREEALLEAIEALVPTLLRPGGALVLKLLESPEAQRIADRLGRRFAARKATKLQATRQGSSEKYLVAREFRPAPG